MSRPQLEVADIIRSAGTDFIERNRSWLRWTHLKVLRAIARCRTAALGGHIDECTSCGHRATISYNSCRNRHCPKCQTGARERWIAARRRELLPTPYVHVVFTLPPQLAALALQNRETHLRFAASGQRRNSAGSRTQPRPSRSRDRLLQRAPYLEPETPTASPCPLCRSRRWTLAAISAAGFDPIRASSFPLPCCGACFVASSSPV